MNFIRVFNNKVSKRKSALMILLFIGLYLMLIFMLKEYSGIINDGTAMYFKLDVYGIRGIITQMQVMLSLYIVLALEKGGYITALFLNSLSILTTIGHMQRTNTVDAMPGVIANIAAVLMITLIMHYKSQAAEYVAHISDQKRKLEESERKLYEQAYIDDLTKLPNRFSFVEELDEAIEEANISNTQIGVIFADLDSFKRINDSLGHSAGDKVLIILSKRLRDVLGDRSMVARFGGDEFIILSKGITDISHIEEDVSKILEECSKPFMIEGVEYQVSGSAGIATYPKDGDNGAELIKNADISMYEAKRNGKNQYVICNEHIKENIHRKMSLINHLYKAVENDELFLQYQPQINVETGDIVGVEALLRWNSSEHGFVSPAELIPLAEQTGLIKPIGLWVFKTACQEYSRYNKIHKENMQLAINFSLEQLKDTEIIKSLTKILDETKMDPHNIEIEITESVAFGNEPLMIERLAQLKEMGFLIAIDDFGKEYSSLNRIRHFPVDSIKIDMDFIHAMTQGDSRDKAIVKGIILLGKTLGFKVLAEGVETKEQYEFLKKEKCDELQGYFFYKPMLASELVKGVAANVLMAKTGEIVGKTKTRYVTQNISDLVI